jgi:cell fate regulator YaaT (PSP1 superfamily)
MVDMFIELPVLQPTRDVAAGPQVVEIAFKGNRRVFFTSEDRSLRVGEWVVVEVDRGQDLGRVKSVGGIAARKCGGCDSDGETEAPTLRVQRRAEPHEVQQLMILRADEERARRSARELVEQHGLKMKMTDAEWQWDKNKLILYFTAERRVDFRMLVRDLARTFRTRIELRQIGVRDEAAQLGGVGRCGRELCCATWLREIKPISLQLAKDQNLSLNPSQISGTCGRLMCCLTYEHDAYLQARKRFPREGKVLRTAKGAEKVIAIDIWKSTVTLIDDERQRRIVELTALRAEIAAASQNDRTAPPASPPEATPGVPGVPGDRGSRRNRRPDRRSERRKG